MNEVASSKPKPAAVVPLKYPVTVDGVEYDKLELRRAKARDNLHAESAGGSTGRREVALLASLAGVAPNVIEELDMADYTAVQNAVEGFLE